MPNKIIKTFKLIVIIIIIIKNKKMYLKIKVYKLKINTKHMLNSI